MCVLTTCTSFHCRPFDGRHLVIQVLCIDTCIYIICFLLYMYINVYIAIFM